MEADIHGSSSSEQGSSWAMEVGGHLKVHSILVENLSKNGQMLVEVRTSMTLKLQFDLLIKNYNTQVQNEKPSS